MPTADETAYGFKYANGHPQNTHSGFYTVTTKYLAPKAAATMAMVGNGTQSEFQTIAMKAICGITCVRLYDIDPTATAKAA